MRRTVRLALAFLVVVFGAGEVSADRPSFGDLDARMTQLEADKTTLEAEQARDRAAVCAKADADGDTYRPYVCTPRCDCLLTGTDLEAPAYFQESPPSDPGGELTSCTSPSADVIEAAGTRTEMIDLNRCILGPPTYTLGACRLAQTTQGLACTTNADCDVNGSYGATCQSSICLSLCTTDAECPPVITQFDLETLVTITGSVANDSPGVVTCEVTREVVQHFPPFSTAVLEAGLDAPVRQLEINSTDASACLTQIVASAGVCQ